MHDGGRKHRSHHPQKLVIVAVASAFCIALASPAIAGSWKHEVIPNDGDQLTYTEDGKVTFLLVCGRGFALHARYPGAAKKDGKAELAISTSKGRMNFAGEFQEHVDVSDPAPMMLATEFRQTYLGYPKQDPRVFGKKWNATKARLLDILDSRGPVTISAGNNRYQLPAIDAGGEWHKGLESCKN